MAEEPQKDPQDPKDPQDEKKGEPDAANLRGELERRKEAQRKAEAELADLRERLIQFEDRDKTELQKAQERAARAESTLQQLSQKVTSLEKGSWVRSAAAEFNFYDPEDAVVNLADQLAAFEDQREARRAVERLAKTKQHLTKQEQKQQRPQIGLAVQNGQPAGHQVVAGTPAQAAAQREVEFAESLAKELGQFRSGWTSFGGS